MRKVDTLFTSLDDCNMVSSTELVTLSEVDDEMAEVDVVVVDEEELE